MTRPYKRELPLRDSLREAVPSSSSSPPPPTHGGRVWLQVGYFLNTVFTVRKVLREYELNLSQ